MKNTFWDLTTFKYGHWPDHHAMFIDHIGYLTRCFCQWCQNVIAIVEFPSWNQISFYIAQDQMEGQKHKV